MTPLAEGADQLAAEVAGRRSIPYRVPIPMPLEKYREDFAAPERLARFDELLCAADGLPYEMPFFESNDAANIGDERRRSHQYAVLAAHLGRAAHVLIALWDGVPSETVGGTAQAVRFRVLGVPSRYRQQSCIEAPETGPVYHVYAARSANVAPAHPTGYRSLRVRRAAGSAGPRLPASLAEQFAEIDELAAQTPDPFETLYARIEAFNQDCARVPRPDPGDGESAARSLMPIAERVATYYQRKYVRALQLIFFATAAAVLTFLLYADVVPRAHPIVLIYLAASVLALLTYLTARRERWQDRAQDYRALEIGLHAQQAWDAAGLGQSVADFTSAGSTANSTGSATRSEPLIQSIGNRLSTNRMPSERFAISCSGSTRTFPAPAPIAALRTMREAHAFPAGPSESIAKHTCTTASIRSRCV